MPNCTVVAEEQLAQTNLLLDFRRPNMMRLKAAHVYEAFDLFRAGGVETNVTIHCVIVAQNK